jgi:hypothetical protein
MVIDRLGQKLHYTYQHGMERANLLFLTKEKKLVR